MSSTSVVVKCLADDRAQAATVHGQIAVGTLILQDCTVGLLFALITFAVKGPVGLSAGLLSAWLRERPAVLAWVFRSSGAVLVALGLKLAFERRD